MPNVIQVRRDRTTGELCIILPDAVHALPAEVERLAPGVTGERIVTGELQGIFLGGMAGAVVEVDPL